MDEEVWVPSQDDADWWAEQNNEWHDLDDDEDIDEDRAAEVEFTDAHERGFAFF